MGSLSYLNRYFWKYKRYLLWGIVFVFISNIFGIIPAHLVRESLDWILAQVKVYQAITDNSQKEILYQSIGKTVRNYGLLILGMALVKGVFLFLVRQTIIVMSRHIEYDLKSEIYAHLQTLPLSFYRQNNTGDLMARISEDVSRVRMYVGPAIMYGLNLFAIFILVIGYMISVNARLTLWVLFPLPFLSLSIYLVNQTVLRRSESIQQELSSLSTMAQETFSGIRVIKSFVKENYLLKAFTEKSNTYKNQSLSLVKVESLFAPLIGILVGLSTILVVYVGGNEVIVGRFTIGNITEFIMYVFMLTWPVTALGWTTSQVQRAAASQKRINELLNQKNTIISEENLSPLIEGEIEFRNVSFTYPGATTQALKNISFTLKKGQKLAILGNTGSGKSTIAQLLLRLYETTEGEIFIDGISIKSFNVNHLRASFGYVPQDVFLFSDTIQNNILFGNKSRDKKLLDEVLEKSDLKTTLENFPQGIETFVGERGITLSGGQKQRVSIARALIRTSPILIFDDCLSAVDTETEHKILSHLSTSIQEKTFIVISHRISSAKLVDTIMILSEGEVIEMGTQEELLKIQEGAYKRMVDRQLVLEDTLL